MLDYTGSTVCLFVDVGQSLSMIVDFSGHFWIQVDVWGVCTLDLDAVAGVEL